MKKVSEVLNEIEQLKSFQEIFNTILGSMESDFEISKMMTKNFGVTSIDLRRIQSYLEKKEHDMMRDLRNCTVDM